MADAKAHEGASGSRATRLRIERGADGEASRVDDFEVILGSDATVHTALVAVRARPITRDGRRVDPPAWDVGCLEGSCGSCTILVGGRAHLACATRIDDVRRGREPILLGPLRRFPRVRDLVVDRSRQDEALVRVRLGLAVALPEVSREAGAPGDEAAGVVLEPPEARDLRAALASCIGCGACIEACPETRIGAAFVGAEAIAHNRLVGRTPPALAARSDAATAALMRPGGIADCGNAQACAEACPVDVPLVEAIADAARETSSRFLFGWLPR